MSFDNNKKMALSKQDKSKKGSLDAPIAGLVQAINASPDLYTTSSCSGRIVLLTQPMSAKKDQSGWIFASHEPVMPADVLKAIRLFRGNDAVWFRMEGFILHACCRTIGDAARLVLLARDAGIKRSGIISATDRKISVEIIDTERIDCPIAADGRLAVSESYVQWLVEVANQKLERTREKIKKVKEAFASF
ncbi:hypothetical protein HYU19_03780 [Candidatus Woesearchaeota archaeon]|nr:hypothetical protein [Candidatus Woesearchaeota archaeon]